MKSLFTSFALMGMVAVYALAGTSDGWYSLLKNNETEAIRQFKAALVADPADGRAYLGLTYAYMIHSQDTLSWRAFQSALRTVSDPTPYVYASVLTQRVLTQAGARNSGVRDMYVHAVEHPDSTGILRAMACEQLGSIDELFADLDGARMWREKIGALHEWRLIGPFDNISGSGHERVFPPETEDDPTAEYSGESGARVRWMEPGVIRNDGWVDFARYFPSLRGTFYSVTYAYADADKRVQLRIGTSGSFKLFLNGLVVHESIDEHNNDLDTYVSDVTLSKGWNRILVKCGNSELSRCNFLLRITTPDGLAVNDLRFSTQPQITGNADPKPQQHPNPYTDFFRAQIAAYPDRFENYFLLAEAHLRNDETTEAELILRTVLKQYPDCIAALMLMMEAYRRGDKNDEYLTTIEHLSSLRPDVPVSLFYKFTRAMQNEQIDEATSILPQIESALPLSNEFFDASLQVARQRNDIQRINELTARAFELHPGNYSYAVAVAGQALQTEGRHELALSILRKHLSVAYTENGLITISNVHRDMGDMNAWEEDYKQLFAIGSPAPGYLVTRSDVYASRREYDKALGEMRRALDLAPGVSSIWFRAGVLERTLYNKDGAINSFRRALACDPSNFDARDALRELLGQPSPFTLMAQTDVDSIIAGAPNAEDYPDATAVYLTDDVRRVVYDGSRSEVLHETIIRILTTEGIDAFKEYQLPYVADGGFTIEKAVVRKQGGKEIPADRNGSLVVFKNLEPGDFMYIRVRVREARRGRLAPYFWDAFEFNGYYPQMHTRYSLLVPADNTFQWQSTNWNATPRTSTNAFGKLYEWSSKNEAAIDFEDAMPSYSEIGKTVQVSSMSKWSDLVDWYYDVARTKTRTSYEIKEIVDQILPPAITDESKIIEAVYKYITTDIRYSNVSFRQSGTIPQKARTTLVTRIGDCKDVATLCIAMLAERGISAYHVLVETNTSLLRKTPLPSIPFDHAIVCVETARGRLFLDLTAANVPIGSVPFGDIDAFCLLIKPGEKMPFRLDRSFFTPNNSRVNTSIMMQSDNSALVSRTFTHTGARTQLYRTAWIGKTRKEMEKQIVELLSGDYPDVELREFEIKDLDTLSSSITYSMSFHVPQFATEAGDFKFFKIPWYDEYSPVSALAYATRVYPIEATMSHDTVVESVAITIPDGYEPSSIVRSLQRVNPAAEYSFSTNVQRNAMNIERHSVFKRSIIEPKEYLDYKQFYNDVVKEDRRYMLLMPKGTVVRSPKKK
ncbi:DUF3857 domain-containing protein [soil metagenome]